MADTTLPPAPKPSIHPAVAALAAAIGTALLGLAALPGELAPPLLGLLHLDPLLSLLGALALFLAGKARPSFFFAATGKPIVPMTLVPILGSLASVTGLLANTLPEPWGTVCYLITALLAYLTGTESPQPLQLPLAPDFAVKAASMTAKGIAEKLEKGAQ